MVFLKNRNRDNVSEYALGLILFFSSFSLGNLFFFSKFEQYC